MVPSHIWYIKSLVEPFQWFLIYNLPSADLDVSSSPTLPTGGLEGILCRSGSIGLDDSSVTPTPSDLPAGCCKRRIGMAGGRPCLVLGDDGLELWLSSLISLLELKEEGEKGFRKCKKVDHSFCQSYEHQLILVFQDVYSFIILENGVFLFLIKLVRKHI